MSTYQEDLTRVAGPPHVWELCSVCLLEHDLCRQRWAVDHEFSRNTRGPAPVDVPAKVSALKDVVSDVRAAQAARDAERAAAREGAGQAGGAA